MKKTMSVILVALLVSGVALGTYICSGLGMGLESVSALRNLPLPNIMLESVAYAAAIDRIDLTGKWKFTVDPKNVGQAQNWQKTELDVKLWRDINVPGPWEDQGVTQANPEYKPVDASQPYSGYAWYRRTVTIPGDWKGKEFYLNLGKIDNQDWTYLNGQLIGQVSTRNGASNIVRSYSIPAGLIKFNQPNVIAIRVLDTGGRGGMVEGPISLSTGGSEDADTSVSQENTQENNDRKNNPGQGNNEITVGNDKVQIGNDVVIEKGLTVDNAVAVGGDVTVNGHVTGDATAVMGDIVVERGGIVDGSAVAVNGKVIKRPGSIVRGETTSVAGWQGFNKLPWHSDNWNLWAFTGVGALLGSILLAALIVAIFPGKLTTIADTAMEMPGKSAVYGIVGFLIAISTAFAFTITLVGIPLMIIEILLLIVAAIGGQIGIGVAVGRKLGAAFNKPAISVVLSAVLGVFVLEIVKMVAFVGPVVVFVLVTIGFGAVILTGFGTNKSWYENRFHKKTPASVPQLTDLAKPDPLDDFDDTTKI